MPARSDRFGVTQRGEDVDVVTLGGPTGIEVTLISFGAAIHSLQAPDRNGERTNVVLGLPDLAAYEAPDSGYLGATVGRYANRIAEGRLVIDGREFQLTRNEGRHHLHGGWRALDKRNWRMNKGDAAVTFSYTSEHGDNGYPGTLEIDVTYALPRDDVLAIRYRATTSAPTVVSLTNHSLFNLAGGGTILDHELEVNAESYTPVDSELIPTGEIAPVAGTPLDFRRPQRIGSRIETDFDQLQFARGYDHNYALAGGERHVPGFAARLTDPDSGRTLEVWTTEPGLQLYTGNRLDSTLVSSDGRPHERFAGVAVETQKYPNAPNQPRFPSAVLRPGDRYESTTELRFGA